MRQRAIARVPGACIDTTGRPTIVWPNGSTTLMQYWAIVDEDHLEAYRLDPIWRQNASA